MMRYWIGAAVLAVAVQASAADIEAGRKKAQEVCAACHGPEGNSATADFPRLAGISRKTDKLLDAQTGRLLHTLTGHENNVICVAFSQDGKRLAGSARQGEAQTATFLLEFAILD